MSSLCFHENKWCRFCCFLDNWCWQRAPLIRCSRLLRSSRANWGSRWQGNIDDENTVKCMLNNEPSTGVWLPATGGSHLWAVALAVGQNGPQAQQWAAQQHTDTRDATGTELDSGRWERGCVVRMQLGPMSPVAQGFIALKRWLLVLDKEVRNREQRPS